MSPLPENNDLINLRNTNVRQEFPIFQYANNVGWESTQASDSIMLLNK